MPQHKEPIRIRSFDLEEIEVREDDGKPPKLVGHAAVFNKLSVDLGGFREQIQPGAFAKTLKDSSDIPALWNHNSDKPLARTGNGSLVLSEDSRGLRIEMTPTEASWGKDAVIAIREKTVSEMSFAFRAVVDEMENFSDTKKLDIRTLKEVRLLDVSPVTRPAYPQTDISARSLAAYIRRLTQGEELEPEQLRAVQKHFEALEHLLSGPGAEAHPETGEAPHVQRNLRKLRLELAARE